MYSLFYNVKIIMLAVMYRDESFILIIVVKHMLRTCGIYKQILTYMRESQVTTYFVTSVPTVKHILEVIRM